MKHAKERALQSIYHEHRSISAVLSALLELSRMAMSPARRPEFGVFHAMISYIDLFPERLHHPKEEEFLFKPLAARAPEAGALVARLQAEHEEGAKLIRALHRALVATEIAWPAGAAALRDAAVRYANFHWQHMRAEERELLPLAERVFAEDDWRRLDAAFGCNDDPLADVAASYAKLFRRITELAPTPVGLGEPWKTIEDEVSS